MKSKTSNRSKIELAPELIEWVAERPAFLYPELLPTSALKPSGKSGKDDKPYFAKAEDNLIDTTLVDSQTRLKLSRHRNNIMLENSAEVDITLLSGK